MPYRIVDGSAPRHVDYLRHHFAYDYQLIRNGKEVSEQRKPLDDKAAASSQEVSPRTVRFACQQVILGPVIFGKDRQQHYDYKIKGRGKVGKAECVIVEAVPKLSAPPGDLFGQAWIDERDGRILRLEWDQRSMQNYESFVETGEALGAKPRIRLSMEFLVEKNGIALPSRFRISEEYLTAGGGIRFVVSETTVTYKDYKFFTVETEVSTNDRR